MNETEIERLVIRLAGDAGNYKQMLQDAADQTKDAAEKIGRSSENIDKVGQALQGWAGNLKSALGAAGIGASLNQMLAAYSTQEDAIITLSASLRANNEEVEDNITSALEFGSAIQANTTYGDEYILSLLAQARGYRALGSAANQAVDQALALASASSRASPEGALRITAAVAQGNTQLAMQMARMIPELRGIRDETEFLTRYQSLLAAGMETMGKRAETASGRIKQLKNAVGDVMEEFGSAVATIAGPAAFIARRMVEGFQLLPGIAKVGLVTVVALTGAMFKFAANIVNFGKIITPILQVAPAFLSWLNPMTLISRASTLLWTGMLAGATATARAVLFVINPLNLLRTTLLVIGGAARLAIGPLIPLILILTAVIGSMADDTTGIASVWASVKESGMSTIAAIRQSIKNFIDWAYPIWKAFEGVAVALWLNIRSAAERAWNFIMDLVAEVLGAFGIEMGGVLDTTTSIWNGIRSTIIDALIYAEYAITNFGEAAQVVWTAIQLGAVRLALLLIRGFRQAWQAASAGMEWLRDNWLNIFLGLIGVLVGAIVLFVATVVRLVSSIPDLIAGTANWEQVWRPMEEEFNAAFGNVTQTIQQLPDTLAATEASLQRQLDSQLDTFNDGFAAFRQVRLNEMEDGTVSRRAQDNATAQGQKLGENFSKGIKKEAGRIDGVARRSAEALGRINDYLDRLNRTKEEAGGGAPISALGSTTSPRSPGIRVRRPGGGILDGLQGIFSRIGLTWQGITDRVMGFYNYILSVGQQIWTRFQQGVDYIYNLAPRFWDSISAYFRAGWDSFLRDIVPALLASWNILVDTIQTAFNIFFAVLRGDWTAVGVFLRDWAQRTWDQILIIATGLWNSFMTTITGLHNVAWAAFQAAGTAIWSMIQSTATSIWTSVRDSVVAVWTGLVNTVRDAFLGAVQAIRNLIPSMGGVTSGIGSAASNVGSNVFGMGRSVINFFRRGLTPGSIYTHDTHSEEVMNLLYRSSRMGFNGMTSGIGEMVNRLDESILATQITGQRLHPGLRALAGVFVNESRATKRELGRSLADIKEATEYSATVLAMGANPGSFYTHDTHVEAAVNSVVQAIQGRTVIPTTGFAGGVVGGSAPGSSSISTMMLRGDEAMLIGHRLDMFDLARQHLTQSQGYAPTPVMSQVNQPSSVDSEQAVNELKQTNRWLSAIAAEPVIKVRHADFR